MSDPLLDIISKLTKLEYEVRKLKLFDIPKPGSGTGDVIGPASSTDNAIARFDGAGGKTLQNSLVTVDDSGGVNIPLGQTFNIDGVPHTHSIVSQYSTVVTSNPPTEDDFETAFGSAASVGARFVGIINSNGEGYHFYMGISDGAKWWYAPMAKALAVGAITLAVLASDTFTDTNGVELDAHTMDEGTGWTEVTGAWTIQSNGTQQSENTGGAKIAVTDAGEADAIAYVKIKSAGALGNDPNGIFGGVIFRYSDSSHYWYVGVSQYGAVASVYLRSVGKDGGDVNVEKVFSPQSQRYIAINVICDGNSISVTFDGGYGLSTSNSYNATATKFGIWETRDVNHIASIFDDFEVFPVHTFPWTRIGTLTDLGTGVNEPTVIYDTNPQILESQPVFKMWYTDGGYIAYAESTNGTDWTLYASNPVIAASHMCSTVLKVGSTYHLYAANGTLAAIDHYTSSDGITWTLANANVITLGGVGTWDAGAVANVFVVYDGPTDWKMLYEAKAAGGGVPWKIGYATSTDGATWSKSGFNPVLSSSGNVGGAFVYKDGTDYYVYVHSGANAATNLPTWIVRYKTTDFVTYTPFPSGVIIPRIGDGEGENSYIGQTADPYIVVVNGTAYMYFAATDDGNTSPQHIVLATADARAVTGW